MIMAALDLLRREPRPDRGRDPRGPRGNLCRCTGYQNIVQGRAGRRGTAGDPRDRHRGAPRAAEPTGGRQRAPAQGGRPADHRPDQLDRQHRAARHAAPGDPAQPVRARPDHRRRRLRGAAATRRVAAFSGARPRRRAGQPAVRLAGHRGHGAPRPPADGGRRGAPRRRAGRASSWPATGRGRGDALEVIEVDYEPLPAVLDMEAALAEGADLVHADKGTNKSLHVGLRLGRGRHRRRRRRGVRGRRVVIERRYVQQRLIPAFMEPRAVVVDPTGDEYTIWSATQIPHILRLMLAADHRHPGAQDPGHRARRRRRVRRQAPGHAGGGDRLLAGQAGSASRSSTPSPRSEALMRRAPRPRPDPGPHARRRAATARVTGLKVDLLANMGAYLGLVTPGVPMLGAFMYNGIYKFAAYRFECTGVFTNKTSTDAYRGAGRPEATFAIERIMDELAAELGIDPMEVRATQLDHARGVPVHHGRRADLRLGQLRGRHRQGDGAVRLRRAARRAGRPARVGDDPVQLGIGISTYTEMCGLAPSRVLGALRVRRRRLGARVASGCCRPARSRWSPAPAPHGQGHETAWSQIVADRLGVPFEDVEVLHGDTRISPKGMDTYGSRSLAVGGDRAGTGLREGDREGQADRRAHARGDADDLEFAGGPFGVRGTEPDDGSDPGGRARRLRRARPARRRRAVAGLRRHASTRTTSPSRTAPTCARSRWTPRPGGSRSARTSRWTTSARWSTR